MTALFPTVTTRSEAGDLYEDSKRSSARVVSEKRLENDRKPPLVSDGLLSAKQFSFAPICPDDRIGDSGNSLLAQSEKGPARQLFVKHTRLHPAANAYIYAKLAQAFFFFLSFAG